MLLVSVIVAVVFVAKVVAIVVVAIDLAPVAIAGFCLPLTKVWTPRISRYKDRFELNGESLLERGAMGGSHGEGNDLTKVLNEGEMVL